MILSSIFLLLLFSIHINAGEQYHIGIINHHTKWYIHCLQNNTRIINPPLNDRVLVPYQCPPPSLSIDILPIEIDFTFVCRLQSRLIWIIVDLYQYNTWPGSLHADQLNISLLINQQLLVQNYKSETNKYQHRSIIINAFYIPFESLENLLSQTIDIYAQINQCRFSVTDNSTWNDIIHKQCDTIESKTLNVQYAQCEFYPRSKSIDDQEEKEELFDDNTMDLPDVHVVLAVDQHTPIETTTTTTRFYNHHFSFDEHYQKIFVIIRKAANFIIYILIVTIIILILLSVFFLYVLCYHHCTRAVRKSSLLI